MQFRQYFTAGMIASGVVLSSFQSLAITIALERETARSSGCAARRPRRWRTSWARSGLVLVVSRRADRRAALLGTLLFGLDLPTDPALWLRFAWIFVLGTAAGTVLGIAYSSVPRSASSASAVVSPVVIVLQFISGVYFVYSDLPPLDAAASARCSR